MKDFDKIGNDIDKAIEQAKSELKARNLTKKVAARAMEIYCQIKKGNER